MESSSEQHDPADNNMEYSIKSVLLTLDLAY